MHGLVVSISCISEKPKLVKQGQAFTIEVNVKLNGLSTSDVIVEAVMSQEEATQNMFTSFQSYRFSAIGSTTNDGHTFKLEMNPNVSGKQFIKIRMYPYHEYLCHKFEMGCMVWVEA
ncbi:MAG: hypothetical protein P8X88_06720 [Gammaproteobacteria bacterium]